jgi:hypothetical protein
MEYRSFLNDDPTPWLLEPSNPSVRYFALKWLLDKPEGDSAVSAARAAISRSEPVHKIIAAQRPEGYWGSDPHPHKTYGHLSLLHWLGHQGNGAVRKAIDYRIAGCLNAEGAYVMELKGRAAFLPCHGGDLLRQMLRFGYREDPRTRSLLEWLLKVQEHDGVWMCISKKTPLPCLWATADVLRALQDLPIGWRDSRVIEAQERAVETFLKSKLYRYPGARTKVSDRWFKFGYPLRWDSDVLEILELIAPFVDPDDDRIQEGLSLVMGKQDGHGRWSCEKRPKGGKWMGKFITFEPIGEPSKWVTLHALHMLKRLYS